MSSTIAYFHKGAFGKESFVRLSQLWSTRTGDGELELVDALYNLAAVTEEVFVTYYGPINNYPGVWAYDFVEPLAEAVVEAALTGWDPRDIIDFKTAVAYLARQMRKVPYPEITASSFLKAIHARPCYQCEQPVMWLAPDARCKSCTRLTAVEVTGAC